jgi:dUTP pyrophosphatase
MLTERVIFTPRPGSQLSTELYPSRSSSLAAGIDLFTPRDLSIPAFGRQTIGIGFDILLPDGIFGQLADCSSFAFSHGGHVLAGVIDPDYQGELFVLMYNTTPLELRAPRGTKIAQLLLFDAFRMTPVVMTRFMRSTFVVQTERGHRGFGLENTSALHSQATGLYEPCPNNSGELQLAAAGLPHQQSDGDAATPAADPRADHPVLRCKCSC